MPGRGSEVRCPFVFCVSAACVHAVYVDTACVHGATAMLCRSQLAIVAAPADVSSPQLCTVQHLSASPSPSPYLYEK
eukprot:scaffold18423_cov110-Isochrysis_galbana.AAC.4